VCKHSWTHILVPPSSPDTPPPPPPLLPGKDRREPVPLQNCPVRWTILFSGYGPHTFTTPPTPDRCTPCCCGACMPAWPSHQFYLSTTFCYSFTVPITPLVLLFPVLPSHTHACGRVLLYTPLHTLPFTHPLFYGLCRQQGWGVGRDGRGAGCGGRSCGRSGGRRRCHIDTGKHLSRNRRG